ncbi:hypothetical protein [Thiolapillus sp.]|uniref:hypothetical protein n=1 Tax=Thiolapillus sp. TaxID=2017437 RepID=UPI0025E1C536|nr:hypothetical protein [Thiolapillus sp.]
MFGVDASYLDTLSDSDTVIEPFNGTSVILRDGPYAPLEKGDQGKPSSVEHVTLDKKRGLEAVYINGNAVVVGHRENADEIDCEHIAKQIHLAIHGIDAPH